MLMYNKELLDKKGVRPPTTFDELAEAAQKLNDQANGISGFVARGLKNANTPVWTSFLLGHGIDPVTTDGKLQTDGPEAIAAAQLYQKLVRDCGPPGVAGFNWYECQAMFMQGRAAMWIDTSTVGATAADPTKSKIADKVGFIAMPKGPKVHRAPVVPSGMAVAAGSTKQGPAWYYVQWATGKANQARQLAGGYGAGGRQSANEAAKSSSEAKLSREWLDVVIQSGDLAYPVLPDIVAANEFRDVFGVALTNLLSPGADAAKELKTATETFKPILERTEKT
jgi:multiple sugar transport system substrate-binding protein